MNLERLKRAEEVFLHRFPGGFENPEIIATRVKKHQPDQMIALAHESFSRGNFRLPERIVRNMIKVINRSSIISVFEKPKFRDFADALSPQEKGFLSEGMEQLLHGNQQTGFEMILDLLQNGKLAKWSLMTVCQTYYHPHRDVFVKPTTVKAVIEYFELENLQQTNAVLGFLQGLSLRVPCDEIQGGQISFTNQRRVFRFSLDDRSR